MDESCERDRGKGDTKKQRRSGDIVARMGARLGRVGGRSGRIRGNNSLSRGIGGLRRTGQKICSPSLLQCPRGSLMIPALCVCLSWREK